MPSLGRVRSDHHLCSLTLEALGAVGLLDCRYNCEWSEVCGGNLKL